MKSGGTKWGLKSRRVVPALRLTMISVIIFRHKGLRQGDSMSPLLFNIVADMLAILMGRAKQLLGNTVFQKIYLRSCKIYLEDA